MSYKIERKNSSTGTGTDYNFTFVSTIEKIVFNTITLPINKTFTKTIPFQDINVSENLLFQEKGFVVRESIQGK